MGVGLRGLAVGMRIGAGPAGVRLRIVTAKKPFGPEELFHQLFVAGNRQLFGDPLVIEPLGFFEIEFRSPFMYTVQGEFADQLLKRKELLASTIIPAEHSQQIKECLGEEPYFPETLR